MSHQLWRFFLEDDLESFKKHLANAGQRSVSNKSAALSRATAVGGSPTSKSFSTSPTQTRKSLGTPGKGKGAPNALSRSDLNARDHQGLTLLHWIVSSINEDAPEYALALLKQPLLDLATQDAESAWTALHRALYFGNVTIARALLNRDLADIGGFNTHGPAQAGSLIKIKDNEGNSPFDLYNSSIVSRRLKDPREARIEGHDQDEITSTTSDEDPSMCIYGGPETSSMDGVELLMFGTNKNLNLGVGDEDDRQYPERISLKRPKHLLQHLHLEHLSKSLSRKNRRSENDQLSESLDLSGELPALVQFSPIKVKDVQLSKLHTAILTDDPEANLYMCGFGPGGRLGTGDESTRFSFSCIYSGGLQGQKVAQVGLGQNHTLAIADSGEVFSWGSNGYGQLGYSLAITNDEEPVQLVPRQIFGPLKREKAIGCAASRIHSVVFTSENLYTFGKNEGQLGLIDSDARSLEMQITPRAVAASLFPVPIKQVTAIDKATACLLENHEIYVFANYGYTRVKIPLMGDPSSFFRDTAFQIRHGSNGPNRVIKLCSGGDTICALAGHGSVFTFDIKQSVEPSGKASTTNPAKIRNALSEPQKIWSLRKDSMACTDVSVGQDGSIIICTKSGSVWRRVSRVKVKGSATGSSSAKSKDYKFSRVPVLTRMSAVRSNAFGSFAAIRKDWEVLQTQVHVSDPTVWRDMYDLCPFRTMRPQQPDGRLEVQVGQPIADIMDIRRATLETKDLEGDLKALITGLDLSDYSLSLGSTLSDIRIPCHEFLLAGRSSSLRHGLAALRDSYHFKLADNVNLEFDEAGRPLVLFQGLDILTLFNLVLYLYTDSVVDVWHFTRHKAAMTVRYKQVRVELQKTADILHLRDLERSTRLQVHPGKTLNRDMEQAYMTPAFFEAADIEIELDGGSIHAHRALLVQRCPFFEGMFAGHSGGGWMKSRYEKIEQGSEKLLTVDMKHVEPHIFDIVLRFLYADTGTEVFDEVAVSDLESFLDIVIEVMSVANELMIDRLAEVCQNVLGKFANVRNVCQLLNAVAPCSVDNFKRAALEYICLNLEIMLESHLLDELEEDLMFELDRVVRDNQNTCFEYTRRGETAGEELMERYPELAERLDFSRRRKIDSMRLHAKRVQREEEEKLATASKSPRIAPRSPNLKGKSSAHDLLFDMDEDGNKTPPTRPIQDRDRRPSRLSLAGDESPWLDGRGQPAISASPGPTFGSLDEMATPQRGTIEQAPREAGPRTPSRPLAPWGSVPLSSERLDMKSILAQADERKTSGISAGISAQSGVAAKFKLSQKERRKQLQDQQKRQAEIEAELKKLPGNSKGKMSAWQPVSSGSKVSLKDVATQAKTSPALSTPPTHPTPSLTMRQTVSRASTDKKPVAPSSPDMKPQSTPRVPGRSVSSPQVAAHNIFSSSSTKVRTVPRPPSPEKTESSTFMKPIAISPATARSIRHQPAPVEPSLQLSMSDILTQQQLEKDVIKEAVAKRSLQEIQEEQAFQEWWDAEEKATRERMQAEQNAASTNTKPKRGGRSGRGRGGANAGERSVKSKGPGRVRGGKPRGDGSANQGTRGHAGHTGEK